MKTTRRIVRVMSLLSLLLSLDAIAAELSPTERNIVNAVKLREPDALRLLERTVRINSGTMNHQGVRDVGEVFRAELNALGFATEWNSMPPEMQRAGNLIARREGTQGKRLVLIGHLDTVFERDSAVPLWELHGDYVHGQGVSDMKSGDVIIIEALRALQQIGALQNTQITVVLSGDEESVGEPVSIARKAMIDAAKRSDIALAFESAERDAQQHESSTVGRRGSGTWTLTTSGKQAHSMGIFTDKSGYGAVFEAARILNGFRENITEQYLTYNPALIVGGTQITFNENNAAGSAMGKSNVIANTSLVNGDLRYMDATQRDRTYSKMRAIVAQHLPGTNADITFTEFYPPMPPTKGNLQLQKIHSQASQDAGLGAIAVLPPNLRGAGDIQFVAPFVDSLDGLGGQGSGAHSPNEKLELASIQRSTIRTALLIYRLTR